MNRLFTAITLLLLTFTGAYAANAQTDTTAKDSLTATMIGKFNKLYLPAEKLEFAIPAQNFKHIASIGNSDQVIMITFDNGFPPVCITFDNGYILDIDKNETNANAVAERVNGILKQEFLLEEYDLSLEEMKGVVKDAIHTYNTKRPHYSCRYLTPEQMHSQSVVEMKTYKKITPLLG